MKTIDVVCIIDDDKLYQYTMKKYISSTEITKRIQLFSDGEEAIEHFKLHASNPPELADVVLLDINMPIMDGWTFMDEFIKLKPALGKKVIIYMVSSSVNTEDIERAEELSDISGYYIKPITTDDLAKMFSKWEGNIS